MSRPAERRRSRGAPPTPARVPRARERPWLAPCLVTLAVLFAYGGTFTVPFIFDDTGILDVDVDGANDDVDGAGGYYGGACGCASGPMNPALFASLLGLAALARRRRRLFEV